MFELFIPVAFAIFIWWFSTGLVLLLNGMPRTTFRWSVLISSALAVAAFYGLAYTANKLSVVNAYCAFTCALLIWGWHELTFLTGWLTGPRKQACTEPSGWPRFKQAVAAIIWHELGILASGIAIIMLTWFKGSQVLVKETRKNEADLDWLIRKLESKPPHRVPGTAVFLTSDPTAAPTALMHNLKHNRVLHERNIILSIKVADSPRVLNSERISVEKLSDGFIRVTASFGFMETPSIPKVLTLCRKRDLNIEMAATSFFLSRRSLRPTVKSELPAWQEKLFIGLAGSAQDATTYFQIPTDRVVEVGTQVSV